MILLAVPGLLLAQDDAPPTRRIDAGVRVRILKASERYEPRRTGEVVSVRGDTAIVTLNVSPPLTQAFALSRLEVHTGHRTRAWEGAAIGTVIGAGLGWLIGDVIAPGCNDWCLDRWSTMKTVIPIGAGIGLLAGGAIGRGHKTDRWIRVVR